MNIGDIPAKWANLDASRPALVDIPAGRRLSFGELEQAVRRLANGLLGLGLAKGDRVAVLAKNGIEYFEIYYACARAGLIAQPLNWRLGVPELARILENGEPSVLVTSTDFEAGRQALEGRVEIPHWLHYGPGSDGSFERLKASAEDANPKTGAGGDDPVLILYTGGTTGLSKGALHSHRTLYTGMLNQTVAERVVPSDVYMLTGQMFHIPVALAMNYMAHGCPVVLMNFDATEALEIIQAERVSAFLGITTMLNWMMAVDGFDRY
ncbi:MAG: acyl--CoA ligase, partial [Gammaproteobacteria bacterium]|nr:acyl--CoA ligase [Gammaproteobacteria bacterium]